MSLSPVQLKDALRFGSIAEIVMALPTPVRDADLLIALSRAEAVGFRKGLSAACEDPPSSFGFDEDEEPPEGGGDPRCAHEWNMTAGEADENNISGDGPQVILCVKCGCCGDV